MIKETITTSWGSRLGDSFKGILIGLLLVLISCGVLFWNEGRTINRTRALKETSKAVVEAKLDSVDSQLEGKVIHLSGNAETSEVLRDDYFNVSTNAIKLVRTVEIYQWQEDQDSSTSRSSGGSQTTETTYSYSKVWSEELIDSSKFKESGHDNPTTVPIQSNDFTAKNVSLGARRLSDSLIDKVGPTEEFIPDQIQNAAVEQNANAVDSQEQNAAGSQEENAADANHSQPQSEPYQSSAVNSEYQALVLQEDETSTIDPGFKRYGNGYYKGTPDNPQIGDIKVSFEYVPSPFEISVISQQSGDSFKPYHSKKGNVELIYPGELSASEMIDKALKENKLLGWLIRLGGFIVMFIGFQITFKPLSVFADIVPFLGGLVGSGASIVAFCLSLGISLLVIAVGWLAYRPLVSIPLIVAAIASFVYVFTRGKKNKKETA